MFRILVRGEMLDLLPRPVLDHQALDIFRPGGSAVVVCVECGGSWEEGGTPPAGCGRDRHVNPTMSG
jgi:hypothetical protein